MDACTSVGMMQVLASVLPANAIQPSTVQQCHEILMFRDRFVDMNLTLRPLGRRSDTELDIVGNQIHAKQLQSVLKKIGVAWSRPACLLN